jgi:hypothetical protein
MRWKTKVVSLVVALCVVVITSLVFASGAVDVTKLSLFSGPADGPVLPNQDGTEILVAPATIIGDFEAPGYGIGDTVSVAVNIVGVPGTLYSYQVNVTWTPGMLNYTGVTYGYVLYNRVSPYGSSARMVVTPEENQTFVSASNVTGFASVAETVLEAPTVGSADGTLFTLHFVIQGYGYTKIEIGTGGILPTKLLDDAGLDISFTSTSAYFRNALTGDANIDKTVNVFDILAVKSRWGRTPASPDWIREYDVNDDAAINVFDILTVKANWGRTVP